MTLRRAARRVSVNESRSGSRLRTAAVLTRRYWVMGAGGGEGSPQRHPEELPAGQDQHVRRGGADQAGGKSEVPSHAANDGQCLRGSTISVAFLRVIHFQADGELPGGDCRGNMGRGAKATAAPRRAGSSQYGTRRCSVTSCAEPSKRPLATPLNP